MSQTVVSSLVDAMPLPALVIGTNERIEAANAPAQALLGTGIEGRHFITALRQPALLDSIESCLRDGLTRKADFLTSENAQDLTYRVSCAPVTTREGALRGRGVLVAFEDVTHLEKAGRMRRDFVANVSHELRTPLTALLGFIETLKGAARHDPAAQLRFLGIMEAEAARMNRLVGDLLSLSRVEADERVRPTDRVDLNALLQSTLSGLMPLAQDAGVQVSLDLPGEAAVVPGDPDQLRQVFTNLAENAIKYGGRGCEVAIALSAPAYEPRLRGQGVEITVSDTGPGIDEIHIPRLTERFYRVDSHRSREMGGTGLGLAIVKHIVNRHRGRLRIDSAPGQGSRFRVILPVA
ncbi:MAG: ATP-binding protein [Paracoccaceae bacterium]